VKMLVKIKEIGPELMLKSWYVANPSILKAGPTQLYILELP
jgi:hypothetical protein